ncbi:hypothetical protein [Cypionkella sp.]|uniref:hypothetical protein n=1 Tax=Cypionkella sp. TaxID=2811411 RepID=UPI0026264609|nr:hypothetical protein [Cypionkella sp.]MDB5667007.1 hypothetical protein [Cypionkella sp.]
MSLRALGLIAMLALTACGSSSGMQLYPTAGPLALQTPPPVIFATAETTAGTSGALSFKLADNTRCSGTWSALAPKVSSRTRGVSLTLRGPGGKFDSSVESVGGINTGEIYAVCKDGTRVQGSFVMGSSTTSGTGTATDTRGNTYKLLF